MCAIIGCFPKSRIDFRYLNHRGPDGSGVCSIGNFSFGHTRLSILDLSPHGHQPAISKSGDVVLTYNGEVYNYKEFNPIETCDTVALLDWLEKNGKDFNPAYLDGMFAFGAFFHKDSSLVLCRDLSGIKPLSLFFGEEGFAFSSEARGFFGIEWFKSEPTQNIGFHEEFLEYGYFAPQKTNVNFLGKEIELTLVPTLIKGVYRLPPGNKMTIDFKKMTCKQETIDLLSVPKRVETLYDIVKSQSMSDVEVGVQMSGGIDSSIISYYYAINNPKFHGFYVSVPGKSLNEDEWIEIARKEISKISDFQLHKIELNQEEFTRAWLESSRFVDTPIARHPNACAIYLLCEYVKKKTKVKVLLTGEGADELFGGYSWHDGIENHHYGSERRLFNFSNKHLHAYSDLKSNDVLSKQLAYDFNMYLPPILDRQDRMSMAHSIESRVPFLSNSFFTANRPIVPGKMLLKNEAASIFGDKFAYRQKCGFGMPIEWLGNLRIEPKNLGWFKAPIVVKNHFQNFVIASLSLWSSYFFNEVDDEFNQNRNNKLL